MGCCCLPHTLKSYQAHSELRIGPVLHSWDLAMGLVVNLEPFSPVEPSLAALKVLPPFSEDYLQEWQVQHS